VTSAAAPELLPSVALRRVMLATVLITSYNYATYLPDAIDSALAQTHPDVEVVVVDDGSTDDSRDIIGRYGDRIVPVLQENAGQAAATNAGFAASRGDVVCLLDADDVLAPEKVAHVVAAVDPAVSVVYHQLQMIDHEGRPIGKPDPRCVLRGDIRDRVVRAGGWWPRPLTSGLSFPRAYLERVMPIPRMSRRVFPDTYLADAAPFFGPVVGARKTLGWNRVHRANAWTSSGVDARDGDRIAQRFEVIGFEFEMLLDTLRRTGMDVHLSPAANLRLRQYRWGAGDGGSRREVVGAALRCPTLPWPMKWREVARILLERW
jgi:glycosyltransferase involved in cell wall biosynthesis